MRFSLFVLLFLFGTVLQAQTLTGSVADREGVPLVAASVYWMGTEIGTLTEDDGSFTLERIDGADQLVASYIGHRSDTLIVTNDAPLRFELEVAGTLEEFIVAEHRDGSGISNLNAVKTEHLNEVELTKAACCDLAGCFNTQLTVQPQTTNVLTNSKELRILGLSGVYNQTLIDGFPLVQGLAYTYGISSIPGTLVGDIFVSKGANSVLQGFESMSGQINVLTRDPATADRLFLNVYANSFSEVHLNGNHAFRAGKWNGLVGGHFVRPAREIDRDEDTFLDVTQLTRNSGFTKWTYRKPSEWGWSSTNTVRFVDEGRIGGQVGFDPDRPTNRYGQDVRYQQIEATSRTVYRFDDTHNLVFFAAGQYHDQQARFGSNLYDATQTSGYLNAQYELNYQDHQLTTGLSTRYFRLRELYLPNSPDPIETGPATGTELTPGIFAEHTARFLDGRLTWIAGLRFDHHSDFGAQWTPRTLVKYDFDALTTVRASIGRGWRVVRLIPENIQLLVSSREIQISETLDPESSVNYGINLTRKFSGDRISGYVSADFYRTEFQNQVFPDYDTDPTRAIVENFRGTSAGNGFQTDLVLRFPSGLEAKAGYNFLDVYRIVDGNRTLLPFNARHKVMTSLSYRPKNDQYQLDANLHWFGKQRLPDTSTNPEEFRRPDFSQPYTTVDLQATKKWSRFEVYAGVENLFDFRQLRPILGWQNPFGDFFDTSSVWGPTRGREVYLGVRYAVARK